MTDARLRDPPRPLGAAWLLEWYVLWILPFAIFEVVLTPLGFGHYGAPHATGLLYLAMVVPTLGWLGIPETDDRDHADPAIPAQTILGATLAFTAFAAMVLAPRLPVPEEAMAEFRRLTVGIVKMDLGYYSLKISELIFQQALIVTLVLRLRRAGHSVPGTMLRFALVFGALHLPIVIFKGPVGLLYVLAAGTAGALVFPPAILAFRRGPLVSFSAHLLGYVVAGLILRSRFGG